MNKNIIRARMRSNVENCRDHLTGEINHTLLAEIVANDLDLYEGDNFDIPETVFELALEFK